jgi:hypothetical protein
MWHRLSATALVLTLLAIAVFVAPACAALRGPQYPCFSRDPGIRGEAMRRPDGTYLYFNGECWTARYVTPTDMPR